MKKKNSKIKKFSESRKTDSTLFDLIHKYNELRSIANAIYNSDYYMIATKKEQKEIEAAATCISKALVSAIGLEAINHDFLPDDSGNRDDRSWGDNLPDDSGNGTDKGAHDAIKKLMNIAYGETKADGMTKAAARRTLNSMYGVPGSMKYTDTDRAPSSIMAMNRKILSELGAKSPVDVLDKYPDAFGNDYDGDTDDDSNGDEVKDHSEINLGNFIEGPFYGYQYLDICRQCGFDVTETLRQIEKVASQYHIQEINLVDIVDDRYQIKPDGKYDLTPGSVFFVTNKNDSSKSPVFVMIYAQPYTKVRGSDISKFSVEIAPVQAEESTKTNYIELTNPESYFNIGKANPNNVIDLNATLDKIKDEARTCGINSITFAGTLEYGLDIYDHKYSLKPGSLFYIEGSTNLANFILITENGDDPSDIRIQVSESVTKPKDEELTNLDGIEFVGIDAYYSIDNPNNDIDLDATLIKIKEKAKEKGIKTITFVDIIKDGYHILGKYTFDLGCLFFVKNTNESRFTLVNDTNPTTFQYIYPVMTKKDDSEDDSSDSKEGGIEVVKDEIADSDEVSSSNYGIDDQYANADTSELSQDIYAKVSFPIFMRPTESGKNVSFVDICDIYDFDVSETIKRIKNVAYQENIEGIRYVDTIYSRDKIFRKAVNGGYVYDNGSLFLMVNYTNAGKDPFFVILRKLWDDPNFDAILYRINPIMRPAKIRSIKKIDIIDTYADGDVKIANEIKNIIDIDHTYKIKEICDTRNYNYDSITSCLKGVTAIIGGGMRLTFEGTVSSLNSIVLVDPVVAYNTCSVFFVSDFVDGEAGQYFVIYMPITGKTKNGYNFRLYRINPIPNLNQDSNTDSQDDSNVREINQFTTIYHANWEVSEADKDAYMKVDFSRIHHSDDGEIRSVVNICTDWKFKVHDTIKRIRLVAYMNNFKEIKFAGTACSHEEILEKEVLYSNGSVVFVSDEEDPHFVIVKFNGGGSTCLKRINPEKE